MANCVCPSAVSRTTQRPSAALPPLSYFRWSDDVCTAANWNCATADCQGTLFLRHGTRWCLTPTSPRLSVSHSVECARVPPRVALALIMQSCCSRVAEGVKRIGSNWGLTNMAMVPGTSGEGMRNDKREHNNNEMSTITMTQ